MLYNYRVIFLENLSTIIAHSVSEKYHIISSDRRASFVFSFSSRNATFRVVRYIILFNEDRSVSHERAYTVQLFL